MIQKLWGYMKLGYQKGLIHILTGNFMIKLVAFFGSIFLVRVLSKEDYGILGYLDTFYGYVLVFAGMGLSNAILRYVVLGESREDKYAYYRYANRGSVLWNIALILLAGVIFWLYPHKEEYRNHVWLLYVMLLMLPFQYLTDNVLGNERATFSNQRYAVQSFALSTAIIVGKIAAGFWGDLTGVIFGQAVIYIAAAAVMVVSTKRTHYAGTTPRLLSKEEKKNVNVYSLQYMITNGLWTVFMLNDTFLLGQFCEPSAIADYRVAYAIPGCVSLISSSIGVYIAPYFVKNEKDTQWVRANFKKTYLISALAIGVICLGIGVCAKPVVWLLYGEEYLNVVPIMRVLLVASFCNCGLRYTTANLLAAMGRIKYNMMVSVLGMLLQVSMNLFIIPKYGTMGVSFTSCVVYLMMASVLLVVFIRQYFVRRAEN